MKSPCRKIVRQETTHGYKGWPSTHYFLSCGHTVSVSGFIYRQRPPKTKACWECYKLKHETKNHTI